MINPKTGREESVEERAKRLRMGDQRIHLLTELAGQLWDAKHLFSSVVKDQAFVALGIQVALNILENKKHAIKNENVLRGILTNVKKAKLK